ncbi:MAG: hypothetical protein ACRYFK_13175 [Janthinobacterium lividum]
MKKLLFALALATTAGAARAQAPTAPATPSAASASTARPAAPLGPLVAAVLGTTDPAALTNLAAQLAQAAAQAPTDWLPRYYQAYALITSSRRSQESAAVKDQLLDRAEAALGQARQLQGDASELLALQGYAYQARLVIDPLGRGQEYAPLVDEALAQAKAANPANPRPYLLEASCTTCPPSTAAAPTWPSPCMSRPAPNSPPTTPPTAYCPTGARRRCCGSWVPTRLPPPSRP